VNQGTDLTCPHCARDFHIGATFTNVVVIGSPINFGVTCPHCRREFDAAPGSAPGAQVTFSTTPTGRLRVLADYLVHTDQEELRRILDELQTARAAQDTAAAARALDAAGVPAPQPGGWFSNQANRMELWTVLALLLAILALLPREGDMATDEVEQVVDRVVQQIEQQRSGGGSTGQLDGPCYCGSGLSFEDCHGAPAGAPSTSTSPMPDSP